MFKVFTLLALAVINICCAHAAGREGIPAPLYETRAVWLTTIGGIDWPHSYSAPSNSPVIGREATLALQERGRTPLLSEGKGEAVQKREFCDILDRLCQANINTVILQTRIRATTIFPSDMEPWDGALSGKPRVSPGYDALGFAVEECHKRGLRVHAWVVTIPIGKWNGAGCRNMRARYPELVKRIGDEGFMNPEAEGTADYLARFCKDIVSRYDVDGIHLDYIRYPDTWGKIKDRERARGNITRIVRRVAQAVRSVREDVEMSCSPVGKYADTRRQWSHGWNARDVVCQDVALWLKEGLMDAIYPMMYFKNENFYPFAIDWKERSAGRTVAPGLGIYMMHPREKNWSLSDITRELWVLRNYGMGNCMFRSKFFTDNTKGIYDYYSLMFAPHPAIPLNNTNSSHGGSKVGLYHLYGSDTYPVDVNRAENLLAVNMDSPYVEHGRTEHIRFFAVTRAEDNKVIREYGGAVSASPFPSVPLAPERSEERSGVLPLSGELEGAAGAASQPDGTLVIISTVQGNDYRSVIVKDGRISTDNLPSGHYKAYVMNKKGYKHLLKRFVVRL